MGHYRSEMGYDEADRKEAEAREENMQERTQKIDRRIAEVGLARFLAEVEVYNNKISGRF